MNRKDRRKQDRMMKKLGIKERQLVGIGVWYKNDQPEGLGIGADINHPTFEALKKLSFYADQKVIELKQYYKQNTEDVETFLDETTVKLDELVKEMKGWKDEDENVVFLVLSLVCGFFGFLASILDWAGVFSTAASHGITFALAVISFVFLVIGVYDLLTGWKKMTKQSKWIEVILLLVDLGLITYDIVVFSCWVDDGMPESD